MSREKSGFLSALGVLFQILKTILDDVLAVGGNDEDFRQIQTNPELRRQIIELIVSARKSAKAQLAFWENFYKKYFNLRVDFSSVKIPPKPAGFDRLIVVAQGLTRNQTYDVLAKHFPCWRYIEDLDATIPTNDRDPKNGAYAIWVRDRVEADEENKNLSANRLKGQNHQCITLLERMLYELKYWDETGQHLDIQNWTLCTGSRFSDGGVPVAGWSDGKFRIGWCYPDQADDDIRSRPVVS